MLLGTAVFGFSNMAGATTSKLLAGAGCNPSAQSGFSAYLGHAVDGTLSYAGSGSADFYCAYPDDTYLPHSGIANIYTDIWLQGYATVYATACVVQNSGDLNIACGTTYSYYNSNSYGVWANPSPSNTAWYNHSYGTGWYAYVDIDIPAGSYINGLAFVSF